MPKDFLIERTEPCYTGFFKATRYFLRHALHRGGMSALLSREVFERHDAVMVIPFDVAQQAVVMIEQFRPGAAVNSGHTGSPWLLEFPAGMIEPGQSAEDAARRECIEEIGLPVTNLEKLYTYFTSPGGCSERLTLFCATVDSSKAGGIQGLDSEHEDLKVVVVKLADLEAQIQNGAIADASTLLAVQWLLRQK
ncbi:MAG: NUDIX domain-containing protein [Thalassospira sp.]|nr:NUDIX domain-containing protein [Thalassospira sp.]